MFCTSVPSVSWKHQSQLSNSSFFFCEKSSSLDQTCPFNIEILTHLKKQIPIKTQNMEKARGKGRNAHASQELQRGEVRGGDVIS